MDNQKTIITLNSILTKAVYILYPLLLLYLAIADLTANGAVATCLENQENGFVQALLASRFLPALLVPGISFLLVSIFRSIYNAPRPYETPGAPQPIIKKDAPGKSFPSRHIFSVFIIAVTVFWVWPVPGILIGIAGIVLAVCRVLGGVHFPRDVIAGALIGIACGVIGFYIIL